MAEQHKLNKNAISSNVFSFGVAILGTGMISNTMGRALFRADDTVYCAAVGSRSLEKAEAFSQTHSKAKFPKIKAFGNYDEAINEPTVRAVYVGVPTGVEEELVIKCLNAGKHVVADKPFLNVECFERIRKVAEGKGLLVMDATHFVHNERNHMIKEKLKEGIIGDLISINANFFTGPMPDSNIRLDAKMEPFGAVGDLGWYTARAAVEYLLLNDANVQITAAMSDNEKHGQETYQVSHSIVKFSNKTSLVSTVGFTGAWEQSLVLVGTKGILKVYDYILDNRNSDFFINPHEPLKFEVFYGKTVEPSIVFNVGAYGKDFEPLRQQSALMFQQFAKDCCKDPATFQYWFSQTVLTQKIVDAMFDNSKI